MRVFDVKENTAIPAISEPFFTNLNAAIDYLPVMNAADLKAGLEKLPK